MNHGLDVIGLAAAAFVSTNVDDLVLLALFFSKRGFRAGRVVLGQYLGIGVLVGLSLAIAAAAQLASTEWTRWLGLLPIAIGLKWLLDLLRSGSSEDDDEPEVSAGGSQVLAVGLVTIANGADNIGVYSPMFASSTTTEALTTVAVFAALTGAWCLAAFSLTHHPMLKEKATRLGKVVAPFVLIAIGALIVLEG